MHAGQGSEGPAAGGDPKQNTQIVHLPTEFFQTTVSTANKPELLSAGSGWPFVLGEEGVAGFLCLCPEGSTRLDTVSQGAGLRQMQALG